MKKKLQILIDKNIFLKILNQKDVSKNYVNWLNDYEVTKFTEQKNCKHTFKSVKSFVKEKYISDNDYLFGIYFNNMHIGNIKLGPILWNHKSAEVSYFIGEKEYWGKGIASICLKALIDFSINTLLLEKINAGYYDLNIGSARVFEKCGFIKEGEKKNNIIFEGKRINLILVGYFKK